MRRWLLLVVIAALVAPAARAQTGLSELSRLQVQNHQLRVENARLRSALATVQADLDSERLTDERAALEQRLRDEVKPPEGHVFDWATGTFVPQKEPPR